MLKKIIKNLILILFIIIVVITLTGCSKQKTDEEQLRDKNISEIQYIDNYILLMLNNINNIDLKQYNTKIENTENLNEVLKEEEKSKSNDVQYSMIQTTILNSDKSTNWQNLKIQIENLNKIWPSIKVDLYKANVENNKLTDFSDLLNVCIGNIKKEDKVDFREENLPERKETPVTQKPDFGSPVNETPQKIDEIDFEKQLEESLKDL